MIPTGHATLDLLLDGGVRAGMITDVFGAAGSGKTQLVMQISARCLVLGGSVLFVDTTGKFRPSRVLEMIRAASGDHVLLDRLGVLRATSSAEQSSALSEIDRASTDLVVVDSVSDLYSFEYGREAQFQQRNALFMEYMHGLSNIALGHDVPVVVTNMIREFDGVELENLQSAIRQFAHARIRLSKDHSGYLGTVALPGATTTFSYDLGSCGLVEKTS